MFKKRPVLTATYCTAMEMMRTAIEVYFGQRVAFVHIDFNTSHGKVRIGEEETELNFMLIHSDLIKFMLGKEWYVASFDNPVFVKVAKEINPPQRETVAGVITLRWVGSSIQDRREEPLFLKDAKYCAEARGMTLDELLTSKP